MSGPRNVPVNFFGDVKYAVSGTVQEEVYKLLDEGGAKKHKYIVESITHCILGDNFSENDISLVRDLYDKPCVTQKWVTLSVRCGVQLPLYPFCCDSSQIFFGLKLCPSQICKEDNEYLWALVTYHGGSFQLSLDKLCTHLLVTSPQGAKFRYAEKYSGNIKAVTPDWVIDSIKEGRKLDEVLYHPKLLVFPKPATNQDVGSSLTTDEDNVSTAHIIGFTDNTPLLDKLDEKSAISVVDQHALDQLRQNLPWNRPPMPTNSVLHLQKDTGQSNSYKNINSSSFTGSNIPTATQAPNSLGGVNISPSSFHRPPLNKASPHQSVITSPNQYSPRWVVQQGQELNRGGARQLPQSWQQQRDHDHWSQQHLQGVSSQQLLSGVASQQHMQGAPQQHLQGTPQQHLQGTPQQHQQQHMQVPLQQQHVQGPSQQQHVQGPPQQQHVQGPPQQQHVQGPPQQQHVQGTHQQHMQGNSQQLLQVASQQRLQGSSPKQHLQQTAAQQQIVGLSSAQSQNHALQQQALQGQALKQKQALQQQQIQAGIRNQTLQGMGVPNRIPSVPTSGPPTSHSNVLTPKELLALQQSGIIKQTDKSQMVMNINSKQLLAQQNRMGHAGNMNLIDGSHMSPQSISSLLSQSDPQGGVHTPQNRPSQTIMQPQQVASVLQQQQLTHQQQQIIQRQLLQQRQLQQMDPRQRAVLIQQIQRQKEEQQQRYQQQQLLQRQNRGAIPNNVQQWHVKEVAGVNSNVAGCLPKETTLQGQPSHTTQQGQWLQTPVTATESLSQQQPLMGLQRNQIQQIRHQLVGPDSGLHSVKMEGQLVRQMPINVSGSQTGGQFITQQQQQLYQQQQLRLQQQRLQQQQQILQKLQDTSGNVVQPHLSPSSSQSQGLQSPVQGQQPQPTNIQYGRRHNVQTMAVSSARKQVSPNAVHTSPNGPTTPTKSSTYRIGTSPVASNATPVQRTSKVQFYGHDPNLKLPQDLCLLGCFFLVHDYDKIESVDTISLWKQIITQNGGEVEESYSNRVTHVLCDHQRSVVVQQALREGKRCITAFWLSDVILKKTVAPPSHPLHLPTSFSGNERPCREHIISITGFTEEERRRLKLMITRVGAKYTGYLTASNTVLIAKKSDGLKFQRAKEWRKPVVNVQWLSEILLGYSSAIKAPYGQKYQQFTSDDPFKLEVGLVSHLLASWKLPIRVSQEVWNKAVNSPQRKRKSEILEQDKLRPKTLKIADDENDMNICNPVLLPPEVKPRVLFSGEKKEEYTKKVLKLGGELAKSPQEATHLVMSTLKRTVKFLCGVACCRVLVSTNWLTDSYMQGRFLSERPYLLTDAQFEETFSVDLLKVMSLPDRRNLFKGKEFYVTPGVYPSRSSLFSIIECSGGTVVRKRSSVKVIKDKNRVASSPSYIIISCDDDLHMLKDCLQFGIGVYSVEWLLLAVMRQEMDFSTLTLDVGSFDNKKICVYDKSK